MSRLFIMICGALIFNLSAQMNAGDMAVVRAILDSAGMKGVTVESVAKIDSSGRIVSLDISHRDNEVGNQGLKTLPPSIGNLTELTTLSAGNHDIAELPQEMTQLTHLKKLELQNNQLYRGPRLAWVHDIADSARFAIQ